MKKVLIPILCILAFALAACSGRDEGEATNTENMPPTESLAVVSETVSETPASETQASETQASETQASETQASETPVSDAHGSDESATGNEGEAERGSEAAGDSTNGMGSDYLGSYEFEDTGFGTQVSVVVNSEAKSRVIESNALPNHETGEFPNAGNPNTISAQDRAWTFTTEPTFIGIATFVREPGVAINGVKFEPGTAERTSCESGEVDSIEAIQDVTDLGLDFNNAHVQPTGEYHYHGVSELLVALYNADQDLVHVGFAADGHLVYYSKSGAYQSSYRLGEGSREGTNCTYTPGGPNRGTTISFGPDKDGSLTSDWDYNPEYGQLDECNGTTVDGRYIYLLTDDYPYISRCLMGEVVQSGPGGGGAGPGGGAGGEGAGGEGAGARPEGGPGGRQGGGPGGGPPDFAAAAAQLGISEQALRDALGGPPPNFEAAAATLGITLEALQDALGPPPRP